LLRSLVSVLVVVVVVLLLLLLLLIERLASGFERDECQ
jgi:hypothetical protein